MRTASSLTLSAAAVFLLLLALTATMEQAEAIRLDAESRAAISEQTVVVNKSSDSSLANEASAGGSSLRDDETKRSVSAKDVVRATAHKLPEFHEDYYGASVHEPRHH